MAPPNPRTATSTRPPMATPIRTPEAAGKRTTMDPGTASRSLAQVLKQPMVMEGAAAPPNLTVPRPLVGVGADGDPGKIAPVAPPAGVVAEDGVAAGKKPTSI